jgi:transposase
LCIVREQIREIEQERLCKLAAAPAAEQGPHAMVRLLARVRGVGVETADMLVNEVLSRHLRDHKAVARYVGLTGSPDESGKRRRERGLARAGNARVRCGMIQLAWRFVRFQKDNALVQWFDAQTADGRSSTRKTMIVALAQAADRAVASGHHGRGTKGCRSTSGIESTASEEQQDNHLAAHAGFCR